MKTAPAPEFRRVARIIHTALAAGVALFAVVALLLNERGVPPLAPGAASLLRPLGLVLAAVAVAGVLLSRGRVAPPRQDADRAVWQAALGRAIVVWALAEGAAFTGLVFWLLTRDPVLLVAPAGIGFVLLVWHGPDVLLHQ